MFCYLPDVQAQRLETFSYSISVSVGQRAGGQTVETTSQFTERQRGGNTAEHLDTWRNCTLQAPFKIKCSTQSGACSEWRQWSRPSRPLMLRAEQMQVGRAHAEAGEESVIMQREREREGQQTRCMGETAGQSEETRSRRKWSGAKVSRDQG